MTLAPASGAENLKIEMRKSVSFSDSLSPKPLNGQHLRVIWPRWSGNPKGLSGPLKGGVVLDYLSARFNFTYEMVRVTENWLEPKANGRGLFSYLWDRVEIF
ncbi:hypothetical protein DAPPUDRAFT_241492 [Daphnia pulex]|uniref:Ionotropic glutamate receptor L-glutamate and glycine-binding domain-containing protein n=1 Tax=Daphnia pulex TaxID=6669 RepID=E9GEE2_DAPPU|nr:hypothetical protein DAPPUDRAFT_241492 [Daphnia pulex]|eukprot:EFX82330.1 hypothetical protein DAPPUDRAFT_241492 [Daphnia pulex]